MTTVSLKYFERWGGEILGRKCAPISKPDSLKEALGILYLLNALFLRTVRTEEGIAIIRFKLLPEGLQYYNHKNSRLVYRNQDIEAGLRELFEPWLNETGVVVNVRWEDYLTRTHFEIEIHLRPQPNYDLDHIVSYQFRSPTHPGF